MKTRITVGSHINVIEEPTRRLVSANAPFLVTEIKNKRWVYATDALGNERVFDKYHWIIKSIRGQHGTTRQN